jgi:hypothetical protein
MTSTAIRMAGSFLVFNFWFQVESRYGRPNPKIQNRKANPSGARRDCQHLAALVKAARRTDPVRDIRRIALRALVHLWKLEHAVVSAALALPAR